jgi:hypothetical protein
MTNSSATSQAEVPASNQNPGESSWTERSIAGVRDSFPVAYDLNNRAEAAGLHEGEKPFATSVFVIFEGALASFLNPTP